MGLGVDVVSYSVGNPLSSDVIVVKLDGGLVLFRTDWEVSSPALGCTVGLRQVGPACVPI